MTSEWVEPLLLDELDQAAPSSGSPLVRKDLGLIDHVQVRLSVVLGDTELSVAELMELRPGRIVPLNQPLGEPVTLQLDGKPVATAHLVAVGDCFGVQIVQVLG